jgi:hypothetical protein
MIFVLMLAVTIGPLVGLLLLEAGAFGPDLNQYGYPNGASIAFVAHAAVFFVAFSLVVSAVPAVSRRPSRHCHRRAFQRLAWLALGTSLVCVAFVYWGAGAKEVVARHIERGEFRSQLRYGYLAYLCRDFLVPGMTALVAFYYRRCPAGWDEHALMTLNLFVAGLSGWIWGYKASVIVVLFAPLVLLWPRPNLARVVAIGGAALGLMVLTTAFYNRISIGDALEILATRATVGSANGAWKVWDVVTTEGRQIPAYWPTLTSIAGRQLASVFGFSDVITSYQTDFTALLTAVTKDFNAGVDVSSSTVTGTLFSEAVLAAGIPGYLLFSLFAGLLVGFNAVWIRQSERLDAPASAAVGATYFGLSSFTWLNSGGIGAMLIVPFLVNYVLLYLVCTLMVEFAAISLVRVDDHTGDVARTTAQGAARAPSGEPI